MNLYLLIANAASATVEKGGVQETLENFGWNPRAFFFQVISFAIVALILNKLAYKPVLAMLEERKKRIEDGLANARKVEEKLAEATRAADEILAKANADAQKMIAEAQAAAKQVSERESQRAVAQAADIIQKAREAGEAEQKRLMAELRKDLSRLIVDTTAKVTGKALNAADQAAITEAANKELAA
ncbi:MAG: synthase subunit [Verrucomicrobiota bacterium]|jgi:F-type H+-transporting ATPase subunit b